MQYVLLACDFDGTLAEDGIVDQATLDALRHFVGSGRKLILVTGRVFDDLLPLFPETGLFERVIAENGAVVYDPSTRERRLLAEPPPPTFLEHLRRKGVVPLATGE